MRVVIQDVHSRALSIDCRQPKPIQKAKVVDRLSATRSGCVHPVCNALVASVLVRTIYT